MIRARSGRAELRDGGLRVVERVASDRERVRHEDEVLDGEPTTRLERQDPVDRDAAGLVQAEGHATERVGRVLHGRRVTDSVAADRFGQQQARLGRVRRGVRACRQHAGCGEHQQRDGDPHGTSQHGTLPRRRADDPVITPTASRCGAALRR
jgi:hypothetical protein